MNNPAVRVHCEIAAKINVACQQNSYPVLRDLRVENLDGGERLEGLRLTLSASPAFLKPRAWSVDRIEPGGVVSVRDREIALDAGFLHGLTEAVPGSVCVQLRSGNGRGGGEVLAEAIRPVEVLARNEWGGSGYMPELLAAFCTPNDPAVDRILHDAAMLLRRAGKPDAMDGYASGSRSRVWEIAAAIYGAIANLGLAYALPPTSFERNGQKIRLPSQILEGGMATCLDSTLLFAAALEKAGLNPIVAMPQGHAMAGVWLQPEELATVVSDDAEPLRKRCELRELILIETTLVTVAASAAPPFSRAIERAMDGLSPEQDETFGAAVDIRQARAHQIRPLALMAEGGGQPAAVDPADDPGIDPGIDPAGGGRADVGVPVEEAPALPGFDSEAEETPPETPEDRLERWRRRLLDLTLRNPLLNHRTTKASLPLVCPDPGGLEDRLAGGARIALQALPQPAAQARDDALHRRETGLSIDREYALEALKKNRILVDLPGEELEKRSTEIYRRAQTSLQEGGANTLYLALGFLAWKRDTKDDRRLVAPLILLPVALQRQSVRSGVKMLAHDDEPRFNTTLLEMLRKDFEIDIHGLDGDLPKDESGVDVKGVWDRVRRAVKDAPGFEVVEDVALGHFSFAKYLMWKDLVDRTEDLRRNPVVRHLIDTPKAAYEAAYEPGAGGSGGPFIRPEELDRDYAPTDLLAPLPADSSQMTAIATADLGKDFIVIGPPGTGKSQTISNLIAHLLGKGKTVLFVSEKTAALDVVYRRLTDIGLGRFCLELHSNKAQKTAVLRQLAEAWDGARANAPEAWSEEAGQLKALRDRLNRIVAYMHTRRQNGLTPHHAIGVRVRDAALAERVAFSWPRADQHDEGRLREMREAADRLGVQAIAVSDLHDSPFRLVAHKDWSPQWQTELAERAGALADATEAADRAATALVDALGIPLPDRSVARMESVAELAEVLIASCRRQIGFALEADGADRIETLEEAARHLENYASAQGGLSVPYDPMAWRNLDGEDVARLWAEAGAARQPKRFFAKRALVKKMRQGGAGGMPDPARDAAALTRLRQAGEAIDRLDKKLSGLRDWNAHETDPETVRTLGELGRQTRAATGKLVDITELVDTRGRIRALLQDNSDMFAPDAPVGRVATDCIEAFETLEKAAEAFRERAGREPPSAPGDPQQTLQAVKEALEALVARQAELNRWCTWRKRRAEVMELGLGPLVESIEQGRTPADEIPETFEAAYCTWWSGQLFEEDDILRRWSAAEHTDAIQKFRAIDETFQKATAECVAARISGRILAQAEAGESDEWGRIKKLTMQRRPRVPIRKMIEDAPEAISALTPCFMMSPLSVAQYLPAGHKPFDVVIFDEASQITVWDAVGAIARGNQTIVAGDPKQMPPTNFFNRADDDPDGEIDYEGDMESILDELRTARIPECTLNLHYRSRRESLIAFSNHHYYEDRLVTFPAPVHPDRAVRLVRCDGHYARGQARHNQKEARAVVAEIVRRLTSNDKAERDASIGVVTFNSQQQSLILDLLDNARRTDPGIEWAFAENATEPVFVKNLETVQGDERDVILFSVTYGPDRAGHVTMNFGPLNRDGGERRLNVAMTRARSEMLVFSTLEAEQIDLSRTSARGVRHLRFFLQYAEQGPSVLGTETRGSMGDFESPFEEAVARALRDRDWDVQPQIGVSAFRIDLGVVHPDRPGVFLAGVECDGAMYHSSAYARERDRIRQAVLEGLGWTLFRVWSTDWWINRQGQLQTLDENLRAHLDKDRARRRKEAKRAEAEKAGTGTGGAEAGEDEAAPADGRDADDDRNLDNGEAGKDEIGNNEIRSDEIPNDESDAPAFISARETLHAMAQDLAADLQEHENDVLYTVASLDEERFAPDPRQFHATTYDRRLIRMIDHVIDIEGPVHEDVLVHRLARHHGFRRSGHLIRERILKLALKRRGRTKEEVGRFFWRKGTVKNLSAPARWQGRDDETRTADRISTPELRAIAERLGTRSARDVARALKISLTAATRARIEKALEYPDE